LRPTTDEIEPGRQETASQGTVTGRFEEWTQGRLVSSLGTNSGAPKLPFQDWRHFKEAFAPELVARAVAESKIPVKRCLDPFGGSGTTALACQFLGVHPITIEVNPFLADLIEAKLSHYDADRLTRDFVDVVRSARRSSVEPAIRFDWLPPTFLEPGVSGRWIFDISVAQRISALLQAIDSLANTLHRRLFRVLLGGILVSVSNVVVNGKGRRYRGGWKSRRCEPETVDKAFSDVVHRAIIDLRSYSDRPWSGFELLRGDSRRLLRLGAPADLAIFSPPYPNSFDYTDIYNVELWALGYLRSSQENTSLRNSTLCSHVQLKREFPAAPQGSSALTSLTEQLRGLRKRLWSPWIPEMIGGYFYDLAGILRSIYKTLTPSGNVWIVVGDSRYSGIQVDTAEILSELALDTGYEVESIEPFRSMRASAQQGGRPELSESVVKLKKPNVAWRRRRGIALNSQTGTNASRRRPAR